VTPLVDVAKRDENPKEGTFVVLQRRKGARIGSTLEGSESSREDEPTPKGAGDGGRRKTVGLTGNGKACGCEGTRCPRWPTAYKTLKS